ncbi:hypothetical protein TW95_gp1207 [Pandoravirus inopinatum]|uniref:Uncharacterized protein n=1 Tax=Pandoravirus inopinatum TaxID=1605721 RepID=A0A0B5JAH9_9VIRU|nr:hypothetical protein TW95_gp1207 [Pandoravirus inopinatum]AJF97941.1 hypothetical protein [Pandoravirus inopinatum]
MAAPMSGGGDRIKPMRRRCEGRLYSRASSPVFVVGDGGGDRFIVSLSWPVSFCRHRRFSRLDDRRAPRQLGTMCARADTFCFCGCGLCRCRLSIRAAVDHTTFLFSLLPRRFPKGCAASSFSQARPHVVRTQVFSFLQILYIGVVAAPSSDLPWT